MLAEFIAIWVGLFLLGTVLPQFLPSPRFRWAQGWIIPHEEPRTDCRVDCATCRNSRRNDLRTFP